MKARLARPRIASRQGTGARARVFSRTGRRNSPSLIGLDLEGCDEPVELLENEGSHRALEAVLLAYDLARSLK